MTANNPEDINDNTETEKTSTKDDDDDVIISDNDKKSSVNSRASLDSNDYLEGMSGGSINDKTPLTQKDGDDDVEDEFGSTDYVDAIDSTSVFNSPKGETYVPPPDE